MGVDHPDHCTRIGAIVYLVLGREREPAAPPPDNTVRSAAGHTAEPESAPVPQRISRADDGPVVRTTGLTRDYGGAGLFDVDLSVPRGSVYGLVGSERRRQDDCAVDHHRDAALRSR